MHLRRAKKADIPALAAMEEASFPSDRLSRASFRRLANARTAWLGVAEEGGEVAGYALLLFHRNRGEARLYSIAVAKAHRGKGIARALLGAAETEAARRKKRGVRLEVRAKDIRTIQLYETQGYLLRSRRARYYEDGADALSMIKFFSLSP